MAVQEMRLALRNMGKIDPESIDDYIAVGGYEALKKARQMDRDELISQVENASKLRGVEAVQALIPALNGLVRRPVKVIGSTLSATLTKVSRVRSRTGSSWKMILTQFWRVF